MLRVLFRAGYRPDLVIGTSIGALVADDPSEAVTDRLVRLWTSPEAAEVYGDSIARQVRRFAARTHLHSPLPLRRLLVRELGDAATFADLKVPFRCCAASTSGPPSTGSPRGPWSTPCSRPRPCRGCCRPPRSAGSTSSTAVRQLDPGGRGGAARRPGGLRAAGRADRAAADRAPTGRGRRRRWRSRSPGGTGSPASLRRCRGDQPSQVHRLRGLYPAQRHQAQLPGPDDLIDQLGQVLRLGVQEQPQAVPHGPRLTRVRPALTAVPARSRAGTAVRVLRPAGSPPRRGSGQDSTSSSSGGPGSSAGRGPGGAAGPPAGTYR